MRRLVTTMAMMIMMSMTMKLTILYSQLADTVGQPEELTHYGTSFALTLSRSQTGLKPEVMWQLEMVNPNDVIALVTVMRHGQDGAQSVLSLHSLEPLGSNTALVSGEGFWSITPGILPAVLRLISSSPVAVFASNQGPGIEAVMAIPVSHFGTRYRLITNGPYPVVHVISTRAYTTWTWSGKKLRTELSTFGDVPHIYTMEREFQAYQIHFCSLYRVSGIEPDLTGSLIEANKPVGILSGDCYQHTLPFHLEEILFPAEVWGRRFLLVSEKRENPPNLLRIVALNEDDKVKVMLGRRSDAWFREVIMTNSFRLPVRGGCLPVETQKPVQLTLYRRQMADKGESVSVSMQQVVPLENWINLYYLRMPTVYSDRYYMSVNIFLLPNYIHGLRVNGLTVEQFIEPRFEGDASGLRVTKWRCTGSAKILSINMTTSPASRVLVVSHTDYVRFGLNVAIATSQRGVLSYPGGAAFNNVSQNYRVCNRSIEEDEGENNIDDDCDGMIDEEIDNDTDDDDDGLVDEDLAAVHGHWSEWSSETICPTDCGGVKPMMHERTCKKSKNGNPCKGGSLKKNNRGLVCNDTGVICPEDCRSGQWGYDCVHPCSRGCASDCDKRTGQCSPCEPEYSQSVHGNCSTVSKNTSDVIQLPEIDWLHDRLVLLAVLFGLVTTLVVIGLALYRYIQSSVKIIRRSTKFSLSGAATSFSTATATLTNNLTDIITDYSSKLS